MGLAAAQMRVATVDLDRVFTAHPKTQAAEESLKKAEERIKNDMEKMASETRALEEDVQKLRDAARSAILTESARLKKNLEAEDKLTELQEAQLRLRRTQETRLKQLRDQLMTVREGIVKELMETLRAFAEEEGYDLILDRSGLTMNMVPMVAYSDPALDVTDNLIQRLGQTK
jgi:outer membrane protein